MEALGKKRTVTRIAFTQLYNKIDNAILKDRRIVDLLTTFELLGKKATELSVLNDEIFNMLLNEADIKQSNLEVEVADAYTIKFKRINLLIKTKSVVSEENIDA